jgi:methyl-galactoside transport system substrate-binding protein
MGISKKVLSLIMIIVIITVTLINNSTRNVYAMQNISNPTPIKVGVFLYTFNDQFLSLVKQNLESIQKENNNKVEFTFFDAKENQAIQNESIDSALKSKFDLFVISLANTNIDTYRDAINKIIQKNIPIIFFLDPGKSLINFIGTYNRAVIIGTDAEQSGDLQGKILVDAWNKEQKSIDKNKDNILQYTMLHGGENNPVAVARTKYAIQTLNDAGIKTEQLGLRYCGWSEECARGAVESLFLKFDGKIEAIISNDDAMAIGAIETLQKYGYNKGDKSKYIPVVGVDGLAAAQDLIKKGLMTGTVFQNPRVGAEAIYKVGMNLISGDNPLEGTNYKFDSTGIVIRLLYQEFKK